MFDFLFRSTTSLELWAIFFSFSSVAIRECCHVGVVRWKFLGQGDEMNTAYGHDGLAVSFPCDH